MHLTEYVEILQVFTVTFFTVALFSLSASIQLIKQNPPIFFIKNH